MKSFVDIALPEWKAKLEKMTDELRIRNKKVSKSVSKKVGRAA
jgi:hypothetical protein